MRPINRIQPQLPASSMKTYEIAAPEPTHYREASCEEVDCDTMRQGWTTLVDESTDLGGKQSYYIRRLSGRIFREERGRSGQTLFLFPAGEECFRQHQVRLDREELYIVRGGDWRGNPRKEVRVHDKPEHWVEDFAEHQDTLEKGTQ